jgi:hypothetical protein
MELMRIMPFARPTSGNWPTTITPRLNLGGLESFIVSNGKLKLTVSVLSHSGNTKRLYLTEDGKVIGSVDRHFKERHVVHEPKGIRIPQEFLHHGLDVDFTPWIAKALENSDQTFDAEHLVFSIVDLNCTVAEQQEAISWLKLSGNLAVDGIFHDSEGKAGTSQLLHSTIGMHN